MLCITVYVLYCPHYDNMIKTINIHVLINSISNLVKKMLFTVPLRAYKLCHLNKHYNYHLICSINQLVMMLTACHKNEIFSYDKTPGLFELLNNKKNIRSLSFLKLGVYRTS